MKNRTAHLSPFMFFCQKVIPLAFDESMSYYETLCALGAFLENEVIPALNNNAEAVTEVQEKIEELKLYVDNYFKNLDIQTEINNKLDEMAESGQLAEIIALYLELHGVLAYDNVSEMKSADNIVEGSICKTLGKEDYMDGKGRFYRVRTVTTEDVIDEENIIALDVSNTLIAELVPEQTLEDIRSINDSIDTLQEDVQDNTTNINNLSNRVDNIENDKQDTMVVFGDSWSMENYPYIQDQNFMWHKIIAKQFNLINKNYAQSGAGYAVTNNSFQSQLETALTDDTLDTNKVKYVFVLGGINDLNFGDTTETNYISNVGNFIANCKAFFPKSQIIVIGCNSYDFISRGSNHPNLSNIDITKSQLLMATAQSVTFIDSSMFFHGSTGLISSENLHPTLEGQKYLASYILSSFNGSDTISLNNTDYHVYQISHSYTNVTQCNMTCVRIGKLFHITVNFRTNANFPSGDIPFDAKPFTNLPGILAPLMVSNGPLGGGTCSISGNKMTIHCSNITANTNYVACFTINL